MYDLILDEVFIASYATMQEVLKVLGDCCKNQVVEVLNVRIDYHE